MNKSKKFTKLAFVLCLGLALSPLSTSAEQGPHNTRGQGLNQGPLLNDTIYNLPVEELSSIEEASILLMREEEKLARDTYLFLYDMWNRDFFANIATSEQRHMETMKTLVDKYSLEDPAEDDTEGSFSSEAFQTLYDTLITSGSISEIDALIVGATIEDLDIADLEQILAEIDNIDMILAYENLLRGSRNHMRTFISQLERYGVTYTPQHISQEHFDAIVSSEYERGPSTPNGNRRE